MWCRNLPIGDSIEGELSQLSSAEGKRSLSGLRLRPTFSPRLVPLTPHPPSPILPPEPSPVFLLSSSTSTIHNPQSTAKHCQLSSTSILTGIAIHGHFTGHSIPFFLSFFPSLSTSHHIISTLFGPLIFTDSPSFPLRYTLLPIQRHKQSTKRAYFIYLIRQSLFYHSTTDMQ